MKREHRKLPENNLSRRRRGAPRRVRVVLVRLERWLFCTDIVQRAEFFTSEKVFVL